MVDQPGADGLVACSLWGEGAYLTHYERHRVLETAISQASGRVPVLLDIMTSSTTSAVQEIRASAEVEASAAVLISSFNYSVSQDDLYAQLLGIAENSPLPLVLYINPRVAHVRIDLVTLERLLSFPQIVGIEESTDRLERLLELLDRTYSSFQILAESGQILAHAFQAGCDGAIPAIANIFPKSFRRFFDCILVRRFDEAHSLNNKWKELDLLISTNYGIADLKSALNALGFQAGNPRPPLSALSPAQEERVHHLVHSVTDPFSPSIESMSSALGRLNGPP